MWMTEEYWVLQKNWQPQLFARWFLVFNNVDHRMRLERDPWYLSGPGLGLEE